MVHLIVRFTLIPLLKAVFIKRVTGLESVPKNKPFILAVNHTSYIDPVLVGIILVQYLNKPVFFVGMKPLAKYWWSRLFLGRYLHTIFVNGVVTEAVEKLNRGYPVVIFPEGGRTRTGELQKVDGTGTAVMAHHARVSVIPAGIVGTFEVWPKHQTFPKIKKVVELNVGKPLFFKAQRLSEKEMKEFIRTVMIKMGVLCGKEYYY